MEKFNLLLVFVEGVLSFLSPCIIPILPIYLSMLSNSNISDLNKSNFVKSTLFKNTVFFTLGISVTFFILGFSVNTLSSFFTANKNLITIIGGIVIVFMGLFYMGIIKSKLLSKEKRFEIKSRKMNPLTSFILGFSFSFGWTPCIGPILSSVLIMTSSTSNAFAAYLLIGVYTIGFILPFILISLFFNKFIKNINKIKNNLDKIKKFGGIVLITSGLVMISSGVFSNIGNLNDNNLKTEQSTNVKEQEEKEKAKAIDFTLYDQYGKEHKLSDYKGKTVFLNLWATWCPPCKEEMPYIEQLYKEYGKNNEDVVILGVASPNLGKEGDSKYIKDFLSDEGYTFPVLLDEGGSLVYQYGISSFPSTFMIDKEGYVSQYIPGGMNKDTMKYLIENTK